MRVRNVHKGRMDDTLSDILQCEEQLRITLHCDDKEKVASMMTPFRIDCC